MKFKIETEINWIGGGYQDSDGEYHSEDMSLDEAVKDKIATEISNQVTSNLSVTITKAVTDKINYSIDSLINDTLSNFLDRKIKITDKYGTVKKEYEDVEEMLVEKFDEFILQPVNSKGNQELGCSIRNSEDNTRLSYLLQNKVDSFKKDYERQIEREAGNIATRTKKQVEEFMNTELQRSISKNVFKALKLEPKG